MLFKFPGVVDQAASHQTIDWQTHSCCLRGNPLMSANILVIGSGGREHALAWALAASPGVEQVWVAPGNGGTNTAATPSRAAIRSLPLPVADPQAIVQHCQPARVELVVIGPETPLAAGLADRLRQAGLLVFGPGEKGARLESSKAWAKTLMAEADVPTAASWTVDSCEEGLAVLRRLGRPLVVKADGLAAGKGVTVAVTMAEAEHAVQEAFSGCFGPAGQRLVLEERLQGPEVSVFALSDGQDVLLLPPAQDHKRLGEGDVGPNTGGMGAYAPVPFVDGDVLATVRHRILEPVLAGLRHRGIDYRGVLYAGLMLTVDGPQVIEFNCRFGDPECQCLLPLLRGDLAAVLRACAEGRLAQAPPLHVRQGVSACVVAAAAGYPGRVRRGDTITGLSGSGGKGSSADRWIFHGGTIANNRGELSTAGGRVLSSVALGADFDQAFTGAYGQLEQVHYAGKLVRRDIGYQVRRTLDLDPECETT